LQPTSETRWLYSEKIWFTAGTPWLSYVEKALFQMTYIVCMTAPVSVPILWLVSKLTTPAIVWARVFTVVLGACVSFFLLRQHINLFKQPGHKAAGERREEAVVI